MLSAMLPINSFDVIQISYISRGEIFSGAISATAADEEVR